MIRMTHDDIAQEYTDISVAGLENLEACGYCLEKFERDELVELDNGTFVCDECVGLLKD